MLGGVLVLKGITMTNLVDRVEDVAAHVASAPSASASELLALALELVVSDTEPHEAVATLLTAAGPHRMPLLAAHSYAEKLVEHLADDCGAKTAMEWLERAVNWHSELH